MSTSRTQNSIRNIAFGLVNRIVSILFPFIVRTIFIRYLGEDYLGLNSLYSSVLQVLNLADLGFASAIVASMYKPIADGDVPKVSALLNLYRKLYKIIGIVLLTAGLILTPFIDKLINGDPPSDINIYALWLLYLINTVVSYLFFAYKVSLINAHQRNDITEKIGAICRIIFSVFQIIVVVFFKNVYLYIILTIINSIVYNLWCSFECNKRYPQYTCTGNLDAEAPKRITKNIGALALQKIGNTVSVSLDSIVISAYLGLTTVAIYGNYYYIVSAIAIFINLIYSAITASIGNSIVTETTEKNLNDLRKFFFLNTWLIGWCCVCFMCLFQDFMIVWMGEDLLFGTATVLCLVLRFYFDQIRKVVLTYKDAAGMWWADKWRPLVGCIVNLVLNIILVKTIGVAGVMLSTVISFAFVELPWETHALFKKYFKCSEKSYYIEMITITLKMTIAGMATYSICTFINVNHIIAIVIKLLICIILTNVIFILLNIKNKDFQSSIEFVIRIVTEIKKKSAWRNKNV